MINMHDIADNYLLALEWSGETTDESVTLVAGNIRNFARLVAGIIEREAGMDCSQWDSRCVQLEAKLATVQEQYSELIMAVGKKYPGETRHQTALKYIQRADEPSSGDAVTAQTVKQ